MIANFGNETEITMTVGGVIKNVPHNNSFNFDVLMPIENYTEDIHKIAPDNRSDDSNTAVALTAGRLKEVGVRKSIGANRNNS